MRRITKATSRPRIECSGRCGKLPPRDILDEWWCDDCFVKSGIKDEPRRRRRKP